MSGWRDLWRRILPLRSVEPDVDDELRFHIEGKVEELVREGLTEEEARAEARRRFGDLNEVRIATRRYATERARGDALRRLADGWRQDLLLALRGVVRRPGFSATVVLTLGLGVGAVTGAYGVVHGVVLEPLPYPSPDRLVRIFQQNSPANRWGISVADFRAIEARSRSLASVAAALPGDAVLHDRERPRWIRAVRVTPDFFATLGVEPAVGRAFRESEGEPDRAPVAVVSHALAEGRFGSAADAVGGSLVLDGAPHEVVGVLPPRVGEIAGHRADVWPVLQLVPPQRRGPFFYRAYGRLAEGASPASARRDLPRVSREIFPLWADSFQDETARLVPVPLQEAIVGDVRTLLLVFMGAVSLVLLIAVANVANLVLARAASRGGELSVRAALGAGRGGLARTLLAESAVLAALGGGLGVVLAFGGVQALAASLPDLPRIRDVSVDGAALAVSAGVTAATALAVGVLPLLIGDAARRHRGFGPGARGATDGRSDRTFRSGLVVGQFALSVPLLAATALLLATLGELRRADPGFDPAGLSATRVSLPAADYPGFDQAWAFWQEALRAVRDDPAVVAAGLAAGLPPDRPQHYNNFDLLDRPVEPGGSQPVSPWTAVTPGFFRALDLALVEGRLFEPDDDDSAPPVAVVTRTWAERHYPGQSAVGRELVAGGCTACTPTTVVGVVEDVAYRGLDGARDAVFVPFLQAAGRTMHLVARSRGPASAGLERVREAVARIDPGLALTDATSLEDRLYASTARPRHWSVLLGAFAAAAAGLAAVGIFGVLSYSVRREEREIGVRMAMGAGPRTVVAMVVGRGMKRATLGVGLGLVLALVATRWLRGLLYGVGVRDPAALAAVCALLLGVALTACLLPARRAARVDPVDAISAR